MTKGGEQLPQHIAVIMDGNGRWAKKRLLPRVAGHKFAVNRVRELVQACSDKGLQALTIFAFSSENWRRPQDEVSALMNIILETLKAEADRMHNNNVQLKFIGDIANLNPGLQKVILYSEQLTGNNSGLKFRIALNYGGQWDITEAAKKLLTAIQKQGLPISEITPVALAEYLSTADLPPVDLLIRTSGEQRISNFLLWQLAYSELYFTETLFPDFNIAALDKAIQWYIDRERRFGKTSEQLE